MSDHDFSCGKCGACVCNEMAEAPERAISFLVGFACMIVHDPYCAIDSLCPLHRRTLHAFVAQLEGGDKIRNARRETVN